MEEFVRKEISEAKREILNAMQSLFRGSSMGTGQAADHGNRKALICSGDAVIAQALTISAKNMGYATETAVTSADALKCLDTLHSLILIDPSFTDDADGAKKIIGRLNTRKAQDRRHMFAVLISGAHKTLDGNAAFMNGVNLIVNKADLSGIEASIRQSQKDFEQMYSTYFEVSKSS